MSVYLHRVPLFVLLPLRLACGYFLAAAGLGKILSGWLTNPLLAVRINEWRHAGPANRLQALIDPLYAHMQHHAQIYSIVTAGGELVLGAALLVGIFSRYAAILGLLLCLLPPFSAKDAANSDLVVCAGLLTLSLCVSGRALGLDGLWSHLKSG